MTMSAWVKTTLFNIRWLAEREPLEQYVDNYQKSPPKSFFRWLFAAETLDNHNQIIQKKPSFIQWLLKGERFE